MRTSTQSLQLSRSGCLSEYYGPFPKPIAYSRRLYRHHIYVCLLYPSLGKYLFLYSMGTLHLIFFKTVDRFGRRPLLMVSATGLSVCFMLAAILLSIGTRPAAFAATAFVFVFQIFLGIGFLPIVCICLIHAHHLSLAYFHAPSPGYTQQR